jgi:hypothetical protein
MIAVMDSPLSVNREFVSRDRVRFAVGRMTALYCAYLTPSDASKMLWQGREESLGKQMKNYSKVRPYCFDLEIPSGEIISVWLAESR